MKKINSIFKIIILFFIIIFLRNSKVYADYKYTVFNDYGSEAPVIFVFHGVGDSSKELDGGELAAYKLIKNKEINIDTTLVYLRKEKGEWNSSTAADTIKNYVDTNDVQGPIYYYGFSQGALNGPDIISKCDGIFTAAVFVDEDFINYNGEYISTYNKISSLKALYTIRGNAGDTASNIDLLKKQCENTGITFKDVYQNKNHAQMNSYSVTDGNAFNWLLEQK